MVSRIEFLCLLVWDADDQEIHDFHVYDYYWHRRANNKNIKECDDDLQ